VHAVLNEMVAELNVLLFSHLCKIIVTISLNNFNFMKDSSNFWSGHNSELFRFQVTEVSDKEG